MLYGQVDGALLSQLVRGRGDGVATYSVLFRDVKINPVHHGEERKSRRMVFNYIGSKIEQIV